MSHAARFFSRSKDYFMYRFTIFKAVACVVAAAMAMLLASPADAGFMTGVAGDTLLSEQQSGTVVANPSAASGIVDFAVFKNTTGNWETGLGLNASFIHQLAGTVSSSAAYVYIYEVVNNGSNSITDLTVQGILGPS